MNFLEGRNIKGLILTHHVFMQKILQLKEEKGRQGEEREERRKEEGRKEKFRI